MAYLRPTTTAEALDALEARPWTIVAGATDHYPARVGHHPPEDVLDVSAIAALRGIDRSADGWTVGALTTWSDVIAAPLPARFDGLKAAARTIGGVQIQHRGTLAGNIGNASPAADGVPVLLSLDAEVELASASGTRRLALADFITGNRRTERRPHELVTAIRIPDDGLDTRTAFLKLGSRASLVISFVMTVGRLALDADGRVASIAVAVGACSPVARRLPRLEARLAGADPASDDAWAVDEDDLAVLSPISDVRASADYRRHAALVLVRRLLDELRS